MSQQRWVAPVLVPTELPKEFDVLGTGWWNDHYTSLGSWYASWRSSDGEYVLVFCKNENNRAGDYNMRNGEWLIHKLGPPNKNGARNYMNGPYRGQVRPEDALADLAVLIMTGVAPC
jgi:hypothetical protein